MKTRAVLIAIGFFTTTMTAAAAHAEQKKHEQAFCASLAKFRADFRALQSTGPSSTMAELRTAADRVGMDADDVERAARRINSPTAKQFTDSARQLREEVQALPPNVTVDQARSKIHDDVQNVHQSARKLATESGCPEAVPEAQPQQGTTPSEGP